MLSVDLNCDLGEGGPDELLMPLVTSVNIACGGHTGDESSMRRSVALAQPFGINLGAHPSFEDRTHFGRAEMHIPSAELTRSVVHQIRALRGIAVEMGMTLRHVKPHGALYNVAARDGVVAGAIVDAILEVDPELCVLTLPIGRLAERAQDCGLRVIAECFADRTYLADGTLTPRNQPHAFLDREVDAADQALWIVRDGCVRTRDGERIPMRGQTLCVHGDGHAAVATLRMIRHALATAGIAIRGF